MKKRINLRLSNKKTMYSMLAFVLIGITMLTVAYATLSTTLKISGSAEFEDASWGLVLAELPVPDIMTIEDEYKEGNLVFNGDAKLLKKPTLSGTSLTDFNVSIKNIGDELTQYYIITNTGDVPALLESIDLYEWSAESGNLDESTLVDENFIFEAVLTDITLEDGDVVSIGNSMGEEDILCPGASFMVEVYTAYSSDAPRVPYDEVTISDLEVDFNFVATDQNLC